MSTGADRIIVTGDLKNDFSDLKYYERKEQVYFTVKVPSDKLILIERTRYNEKEYTYYSQ